MIPCGNCYILHEKLIRTYLFHLDGILCDNASLSFTGHNITTSNHDTSFYNIIYDENDKNELIKQDIAHFSQA